MRKLFLCLALLLVSFSAFADSINSNGSAEVSVVDNAKTPIVEIPDGLHTLIVDECSATNNSGSSATVGCGRLKANSMWTFGIIDSSATPDYSDDTADAQDADAGDIDLFSTTNNDGHLVCSDHPFNSYGVTVSQAEAGSPVYAYTYYNGASMVSLSTVSVPANYTTGDLIHLFNAPGDWAVGTPTSIGGPANQYCIQAVATTAPSQVVQGSIMWSMHFDKIVQGVADKSFLNFDPNPGLRLRRRERPLCYFSVANAANSCSILWRGE